MKTKKHPQHLPFNGTHEAILAAGVSCLKEQSEALGAIAQRMDDAFVQAVELLAHCKGRLIVSGMGKSGIIGKKIAATLASTGTPAFFVHPAEAYHGDLGMITPQDQALLLSYSGETEEMVRLIPWLEAQSIDYVALTGNPKSSLAKNAKVHLNVSVPKEACPHNLAPTTSTTAALAMGDALAVTLMKMRGFEPHHFALFHPGGSLGRRLLTRVKDVMHKNPPSVSPDTPLHQIIMTISKGRLGLTLVQEDGALCGIITDGDIRRTMQRFADHPEQLLNTPAEQIMSSAPLCIHQDQMFSTAQQMMIDFKVNSLVVLDDAGTPVGCAQIFDL